MPQHLALDRLHVKTDAELIQELLEMQAPLRQGLSLRCQTSFKGKATEESYVRRMVQIDELLGL